MKTDSLVRLTAGTLMLLSIALGYFVGPGWLLLGVFVGMNLVQSALTGFCPACIFYRKMGWSRDADACECAPRSEPK